MYYAYGQQAGSSSSTEQPNRGGPQGEDGTGYSPCSRFVDFTDDTWQLTRTLLEKDDLRTQMFNLASEKLVSQCMITGTNRPLKASGAVGSVSDKAVLELRLQLSEAEKQNMESNNRVAALNTELQMTRSSPIRIS